MISVEHTKEIRDYLLSKKIPLDILIEVEDHILNQIDDLRSQNISFEKAFDEVKEIWKKDLVLTKINGEEVAVFVKDIKEKAMIKIFRKSLLVFIFINLIVFILSKLLEKDVFSEMFPFFIMFLTGIPSVFFLWYIRYFNYAGQFKKVKFNIFHSQNVIIILVGAFQPFLLGKYGKIGALIYSWFEQGSLRGLFSLIVFSGCAGLYSYGFFNMLGFVKSMKKIKPYFKTLTF